MSRFDAFLLVALTLIWGLNWPVMKFGVADFPAMSFRSLSIAGGLVVVGAVGLAQTGSLRLERRWWRETAVLGLFNMVIWFVLSIIGIQMLASGRAAILGYTLPVWVALIGWVAYRERQGLHLLWGLLAAGIGVVLLLGQELGSIAGRPLGAVVMLAAAFTWAIGTHLLQRRKCPDSIVVLTFWMMVQSLIACVVLALLFERDRWQRWPSAGEWAAIGYNTVLAYGIGQLLWFRLATRLPPVVSALSVMLIPVVGVFSGVWLLGEQLGWRDYAALVAMLAAIAATRLPAAVRAASPAGAAAPPAAGGADPGTDPGSIPRTDGRR